MTKRFLIFPGSNLATGATVHPDGVNFCIFSRHATDVALYLYAHTDSESPMQVVVLDAGINRTFFFWHVFVEGLKSGCVYSWVLDGSDDTKHTGLRFDNRVALLDPWARAVSDKTWDREKVSRVTSKVKRSKHDKQSKLKQSGSSAAHAIRGVVTDNSYDWEGDEPINHPLEESIIYELHVGGFTKHPSAGVKHPGTFSALIEKIPYLKKLGITEVELMPIMAFDEQDLPPDSAKLGLKNYWGYSTHSFYAPHPHYCQSENSADHVREFRDMVKAFHRAGIGVILDVVYNHTSEGGEGGPTINFKGFFNDIMYHLNKEDKRKYRDYTGCGNTVNCNHPMVTRFIIDSLIYWVEEMHVDGFRFDLASVFSRDENGHPIYNAPLPWSIEFSQSLRSTKIIAETWDAAGLYQLGTFPGFRWSEWNGRYRDVIRRFIRGDKGMIGELASCITGSSDVYQPQDRLPINSINFITCHDGFTLNDLLSYNHKHNEANGEQNHDGHNDNLSWNYGIEGETDDIDIRAVRLRQTKNIFTLLLLSQGVPMLYSGDEISRSQKGNNNTYCQDNELNWFDWRSLETHKAQIRFLQQMNAFRKRHRSLRDRRFLTGAPREGSDMPDIRWHGLLPEKPLWSDENAQVLAFTIAAIDKKESHLHVMINMADSHNEFTLPNISGRNWSRAIDTYLIAPDDILPPREQPSIDNQTYVLHARSIVVLEG